MAVVLHHVRTEPVPPSKRTEIDVPEALERVIMSCLEKDPANRPQSADELDRLLAAAVTDRVWDREKAENWWRLHMPESVTDVLGEPGTAPSPQEVLAVKR